MEDFKKIDLVMQIFLLLCCLIPPIIHIYYSILLMATLPILGAWQLISVGLYASKKQLNKWHRLYLKILVGALSVMIVEAIMFMMSRYDYETILFFSGIGFGFSLALFYIFVSYKTLSINT